MEISWQDKEVVKIQDFKFSCISLLSWMKFFFIASKSLNLQQRFGCSSSPHGQSSTPLHQLLWGIQTVLFSQRKVPTGQLSVNRVCITWFYATYFCVHAIQRTEHYSSFYYFTAMLILVISSKCNASSLYFRKYARACFFLQ